MIVPQPGIFAQGTRTHHHLELDLRDGVDPAAVARAVLALREPPVTAGGTNLVVGFGAELWRRLAPGGAPADLEPMLPVHGEGRSVPATQHDLWVWLHGAGPDAALDNARAVVRALAPVADLAQEQACFVYHDSRDLTGFIDGTANPPIEEATGVAILPEGVPGAGGAFVLAMRWRHDLAAFEALPTADQEAVIGRTKPDSVELDPNPPTSHVSRVVIEDDEGEELELYRRSAPWGTAAEHGLYFLAFSADPGRFLRMLERMFGAGDDGLHDRLTDFSTPLSAAVYFAPSIEALSALSGV